MPANAPNTPATTSHSDWRRYLPFFKYSVAADHPAGTTWQVHRTIPTLEFLRYNGGLTWNETSRANIGSSDGTEKSGAKMIGFNPFNLVTLGVVKPEAAQFTENVQDALDAAGAEMHRLASLIRPLKSDDRTVMILDKTNPHNNAKYYDFSIKHSLDAVYAEINRVEDEAAARSDEIEEGARKINAEDNENGSFAFTNYDGEEKIIPTGKKVQSTDNTVAVTENTNDFDLSIKPAIDAINERLDSVENLGDYVGSFASAAALPANASAFDRAITVNDFATVRADGTPGSAPARYVVSAIDGSGAITWTFDVDYSTDISGKQDRSTANYQMGNSSGSWTTMSAAQQNALNSGATTSNINSIASKIDTLSAGSGISISGSGTSRTISSTVSVPSLPKAITKSPEATAGKLSYSSSYNAYVLKAVYGSQGFSSFPYMDLDADSSAIIANLNIGAVISIFAYVDWEGTTLHDFTTQTMLKYNDDYRLYGRTTDAVYLTWPYFSYAGNGTSVTGTIFDYDKSSVVLVYMGNYSGKAYFKRIC